MRQNLTIIIKYFKKFKINKKYLILMFITSFLASISNIISPIFNGKLIAGLIENNYNNAFLYLGVFILLLILYNVFYSFNFYFYSKFFKYNFNNLHKQLSQKLFEYDRPDLTSDVKGKFTNVVSDSVDEVSDLGDLIVEGAIQIISLVASIIILFTINFNIALIIVLINLITIKLIDNSNQKAERLDKKRRDEKDKLINVFTSFLSSIEEIKNLNVESRMRKKYAHVTSHFVREKTHLTFNNMSQTHIIPSLGLLLQAGLMIYLIFLIKGNVLKVDDFVVIITYYAAITAYTKFIMTQMRSIRISNVSMERVLTILDKSPANKHTFGENPKTDINGTIEFDDVHLSFNNNQLFKGLSFTIPCNQTTVIVGKSGSGKSSLLNLILRKIKPSSGTITIDGIDLYDYSKDAHNQNVGIVMQKPIFFDMSILNNLKIADSQKKYEEIIKLLKIDDLVAKLPQGINTMITSNTDLLTLEEKQKLALARVLILDTQIILLDELTNKLDSNIISELDEITNSLEGNHTIVSITSNKEEMRNSDYILVLKDGQIVAAGTHEDLLNNEHYLEFYKA